MKISIINYSGTVGKTTLAVNLFQPRMNDAQIISVESVNESVKEWGAESEKLRGSQFKEIFSRIIMLEDVIVDVGSSNVESFLDGMLKYEGSNLEFDFYIIPVTPGTKTQKEALSMLLTLTKYEIPNEKIKLIYNRVERDVENEFPIIKKFVIENPFWEFNNNHAVMENELFDLLSTKKMSISQLVSEETDYRQELRNLPNDADKAEYKRLIDLYTMSRLSLSVNRNLNNVFHNVFGAEYEPEN